MIEIDKNSPFWNYLSPGQKGLIEEGEYLLEIVKEHPDPRITDYSYLVFPFAKAYEGFLKQLFLDLKFITNNDYESDRYRIGRALNPFLEKCLRYESVYDRLVNLTGNKMLAEKLWSVWRRGRNLLFHYFPHNLKALKLNEAEDIISEIIITMQQAVTECKINMK